MIKTEISFIVQTSMQIDEMLLDEVSILLLPVRYKPCSTFSRWYWNSFNMCREPPHKKQCKYDCDMVYKRRSVFCNGMGMGSQKKSPGVYKTGCYSQNSSFFWHLKTINSNRNEASPYQNGASVVIRKQNNVHINPKANIYFHPKWVCHQEARKKPRRKGYSHFKVLT